MVSLETASFQPVYPAASTKLASSLAGSFRSHLLGSPRHGSCRCRTFQLHSQHHGCSTAQAPGQCLSCPWVGHHQVCSWVSWLTLPQFLSLMSLLFLSLNWLTLDYSWVSQQSLQHMGWQMPCLFLNPASQPRQTSSRHLFLVLPLLVRPTSVPGSQLVAWLAPALHSPTEFRVSTLEIFKMRIWFAGRSASPQCFMNNSVLWHMSPLSKSCSFGGLDVALAHIRIQFNGSDDWLWNVLLCLHLHVAILGFHCAWHLSCHYTASFYMYYNIASSCCASHGAFLFGDSLTPFFMYKSARCPFS